MLDPCGVDVFKSLASASALKKAGAASEAWNKRSDGAPKAKGFGMSPCRAISSIQVAS